MKEPMAHYLLNMITSWAIVCDVWYLPPQTKRVKLTLHEMLGLDLKIVGLKSPDPGFASRVGRSVRICFYRSQGHTAF